MWRSKYRIDDKSDVSAVENTITISVRGDVQENMENAINYITSKGFKLERLPYADHVPEFKSLENADPIIVAQIKEGLRKYVYGRFQSMNQLKLIFLMLR